ncbi:MAG: VC0807 family protein [Acidimicrobiales bacterium]
MQQPLIIPGPGAVLRHSWPNVLVGKVVPLVLFLSFLRLIGTTGALIAALGWSVAVVIHRRRAGREVPGLVLLSTIGLAAKTVLALATGSLVVYFLQPTITTAMVGVAFLASVLMGKPLAERLAGDFCPFDPETAEHPLLRLFFARLSLLWAATSLANAAVTLWLLFTQSVTTFVIIKSFMGPTFTAATLGIAAVWFRFRTRQDGVQLHFAKTMDLGSANVLVPELATAK